MTEPIPIRRNDPPPPPPQDVTRELGHGQSSNWWMTVDDESVPQLQWPESVGIYDKMRRSDPQVTSVIRAITLPIRQTAWRIDPNGAPDEVVDFVSQNLGLPVKGKGETVEVAARRRDRFSWSQHLQWALLCTVYGHMFFEQVYREDETTGLFWLRKLAPRWPKTIQKINVARDGGLVSIEQRPLAGLLGEAKVRQRGPGDQQGNVVLSVDRLVGYVYEREGGSWVGLSVLRAAHYPWALKTRSLRIWVETLERNGMGVPVYTASDQETSLDRGMGIAVRHRAGQSSGAAIPWGAKLELLGVQGALPDPEKAVRYFDEAIGRSVLAHFLNLGQSAGTGSWALGTTFADFFVMSLDALAALMADTASQHIVEDLVDLNFGDDVPAPRVVYDPIGQNPAAVVQAVQMLIAAGAIFPDPDLDAFMRGLVGLPPKAPLPNARTATGAAGPPEGTPTP